MSRGSAGSLIFVHDFTTSFRGLFPPVNWDLFFDESSLIPYILFLPGRIEPPKPKQSKIATAQFSSIVQGLLARIKITSSNSEYRGNLVPGLHGISVQTEFYVRGLWRLCGQRNADVTFDCARGVEAGTGMRSGARKTRMRGRKSTIARKNDALFLDYKKFINEKLTQLLVVIHLSYSINKCCCCCCGCYRASSKIA